MLAFLQGGSAARDAAQQVIEFASSQDPDGVVVERASVELLSPVPRPESIREFMVFEQHVINCTRRFGMPRWAASLDRAGARQAITGAAKATKRDCTNSSLARGHPLAVPLVFRRVARFERALLRPSLRGVLGRHANAKDCSCRACSAFSLGRHVRLRPARERWCRPRRRRRRTWTWKRLGLSFAAVERRQRYAEQHP